eukprot:9569821-Prorocentrum_lima.AAC.1
MKHKKKLPIQELPQGRNIPPAKSRRICELWIAERLQLRLERGGQMPRRKYCHLCRSSSLAA